MVVHSVAFSHNKLPLFYEIRLVVYTSASQASDINTVTCQHCIYIKTNLILCFLGTTMYFVTTEFVYYAEQFSLKTLELEYCSISTKF